jgi:transposase
MKKILPEKKFGDVDQLEKLIKQERNAKLVRRINAIRLLMLGYKHKEVAKISGVSRYCLRKWVKKWNQSGKEGLISKSGGSISKIIPDVRLDITKVVEAKIYTNGRIVTGKITHGYLKKTQHKYKLLSYVLYIKADGICKTETQKMASQA